MPYSKVWLHLIWSTKNREKLISKEIKPILINHIYDNARKKQLHIDCINCVADHIHMLVSLGREQTISNIVKLIKGESSYWLNKNGLENFECRMSL